MSGDDVDQLQDGTHAGDKTELLQQWEDLLGESDALSRRANFTDITVHLAELGLPPKDVFADDIKDIVQLLESVGAELELDSTTDYLFSQHMRQHKRKLQKGAKP